VNVAVTDRHGNPVNGLSAADFTLLEDGQPKKTRSFGVVEQGRPKEAGEAEPRTILIFTKESRDNGSDAQPELIDALKKYQGTLPEPTMLLSAPNGPGWVMLHDYTRDGQALIQALRREPSPDSGILNQQADTQQLWKLVKSSQNVSRPTTIIWVSTVAGGGMSYACRSISHDERSPLKVPYSLQMREADQLRNQSTLLFTENITLDVLLHPQAEETCGETPPASDSSGFKCQTWMTPEAKMPPILKKIDSGEAQYGSAVFSGCGLSSMAPESGGVTVLGRGSDIQKELAQSMNRAANYYTLTYRSSVKHIDGQFRRIQVSVDRPKVKIYARNGYYAMPYAVPPSGPGTPHP
jgi:VWFA-related protein